MKRVLIITYYWPPAGGSGVQRWVKFAKYLPKNGWTPIIYTPLNPTFYSLDKTMGEELPPEVQVLKRPITEPYSLYHKLMGKERTVDMRVLTATGKEAERKAPASFKDKVSLWLRSNLFIPDPRVWWVRPSVKWLKEWLEEHPVDLIVTTGPPQSMHLIGQRLHKELGLPWIPDFRDPWTKMYWFKRMRLTKCSERKHRRLERAALDQATAVMTVTPLMAENYQRMTETPVHVITNGYDEEDFNQAVELDGHFNIVHTGILSADGNPVALWNSLKEKAASDPAFDKELRIRLVGQTDDGVMATIREAGLSGHVIDLGYQSHRIAVREQMAASVLALPQRDDPDMRMILQGKVFEYLAARRPIIGFGREDGDLARVIAEAKAGKVFSFNDKAGIRAFIDDAWEKHRSGTPDPCTGDVEQYSRRRLTERLAELFNSLTKR